MEIYGPAVLQRFGTFVETSELLYTIGDMDKKLDFFKFLTVKSTILFPSDKTVWTFCAGRTVA